MKISKAKYEADARYIKRSIRTFTLKLNRNTEPELIEWLESKENISSYLKDLIKKDKDSQ